MTDDTKAPIDLSSMSDEDIMNMTDEDLFPQSGNDSEGGTLEDSTETDSLEEDNHDDVTGGAGDDEDSPEEELDSGNPSAEDQGSADGSDHGDEDSDESPKDDQSEDKDKSEEPEDVKTDTEQTFEAKYNELMAPFKAAKRMVTVGNIDDARQLMQKGVDYSRKMESMKPHLRILRTLEKAGLTDPSRINFLIDLDNKNPEAIKKLLKDNAIDPMTLNLEGSEDYKPTDHTISDTELQVRDVLDSIKDDPKFDVTIDVISKRMDKASRATLQERPEVIAEIHNHIEAGVYDTVQERVVNERMFGRLKGLSDLEAYYTVGDAMYKAGEFGNEPQPNTTTTANDNPKGAAQGSGSEAKGDSQSDANLRNRKSAAKTPRGRQRKGGKPVPNFAKMTDAEIEALDISSF